VRVVDGVLKEKDKIKFINNGNNAEVEECGVLYMNKSRTKELEAGNVGYVIAGLKNVRDTKVGDTITSRSITAPPEPLVRIQRSEADGLQRIVPHEQR
jgi:GTP-binding protein LepA